MWLFLAFQRRTVVSNGLLVAYHLGIFIQFLFCAKARKSSRAMRKLHFLVFSKIPTFMPRKLIIHLWLKGRLVRTVPTFFHQRTNFTLKNWSSLLERVVQFFTSNNHAYFSVIIMYFDQVMPQILHLQKPSLFLAL